MPLPNLLTKNHSSPTLTSSGAGASSKLALKKPKNDTWHPQSLRLCLAPLGVQDIIVSRGFDFQQRKVSIGGCAGQYLKIAILND